MKQATRFTVHQGWKILCADMGLSPTDVLRVAGLTTDLFVQKDASLSVSDFFRLWQAVEQLAGDMEFPLQMGEMLSAESFDPPIFASLCSPNLNVALERLKQFKPLIGPLQLSLDVTDTHTSVLISCYQHNEPIPRSVAATELVFITQLARLATRQRIVPTEVICTTQLRNANLYQDYFGVAVKQGDVNRISFSSEDAQRPFLTENAGMWHSFEPELQQRLSTLEQQSTTQQRVKSALLELLPSGQGSIDFVAKRLAVSKRTLQRRLNREQLNFQAVLNTTRKELAQHYLSNSTLCPSEISFLLGFQETSSFYRAFNTWTGQTPDQFRSTIKP